MAITKTNYRLEEVKFEFDESNDVSDMSIQVSYDLWDDAQPVGEEVVTRVRETKLAGTALEPDISASALNNFGKRCKAIAVTLFS